VVHYPSAVIIDGAPPAQALIIGRVSEVGSARQMKQRDTVAQ